MTTWMAAIFLALITFMIFVLMMSDFMQSLLSCYIKDETTRIVFTGAIVAIGVYISASILFIYTVIEYETKKILPGVADVVIGN